MYILVSHPRFGTTWVNQHIQTYCLNQGMQQPIPESATMEFLNDRFHHVNKLNGIDVPNLSWDEKVALLEMKREIGIECTYKVHAKCIKDKEWFNQFYKDWTVIKLDRKDLWRPFLSYCVQRKLGWDPFLTHREESLKKRLRSFWIDTQFIDVWFDQYLEIDKVEGLTIYYEDLDEILLSSFFDIPKHPLKKMNINYDSYIFNYKEIKTAFQNKYNSVCQNRSQNRQVLHLG